MLVLPRAGALIGAGGRQAIVVAIFASAGIICAQATPDENFMKWALHQIINWKNKDFDGNIVHIQGNRDLILPHYFVKFDYLIDGGTHFMTLNQSKKIEQIILDNLV